MNARAPDERAKEVIARNPLLPVLLQSADAVAVFYGEQVIAANAAYATLVGSGAPHIVVFEKSFFDDGLELKAVALREKSDLAQKLAKVVLHDRLMSVGTLAAGVAHEINNPLSYVIGNLSFLAEEAPVLFAGRPDIQEALDEAREGAERVRQIVRDLQSFGRADHQTSRSVDARRVVELSINMVWIEIRHRARLVRDLQEVPPVEASEALLGQVFLSLLLNAAQSLPEGGAEKHQIRVATRAEGDQVLVEISDTGPPLSEAKRARLFDPFSASGVGVSIANTIVGELGGTLRADEAPGGGTIYTLSLPRAVEKHARPISSPSGPVQQITGRGRVLVIDDELLIATSLKRALRDHDVTVVSSGRMAIEMLEKDAAFDLVFCDLMMPELTGMDVYDWLRDARPGMEERVVFMSGGAFTQRAGEFLEVVPNMRFEKPFELDKVRVFVRDYLNGSATARPQVR
jgi:signal transduction histidine kinase/CheY-like chemotaxis protein